MTGCSPTLRDLTAMRRLRTLLVVATAVLQGGQYLLTPDRALSTPAYFALVEIGTHGWQIIGVLVVVGGGLTAAPRSQSVGFVWLALMETFLGAAQLLHGYAPSTLVLPVGLCLTEVALTARLRRRSPQRGGHGCG